MIKQIFVFGSNEAGFHGAGAARYAQLARGAKPGKGVGLHGSSYALPTKSRTIRTLPLEAIKEYVEEFKAFAHAHPEYDFQVTRVGCGLAGYQDKVIAPMFIGCPSNCQFDEVWRRFLGDGYKYWGTS